MSTVRRSLFSQVAEVSLTRKRAKLPEQAPQTESVSVGGSDARALGLPGAIGGLGSPTLAGIGGGRVGERVYSAAQEGTRRNWTYSHERRNSFGPAGYTDCSSGVSWVLATAGIRCPNG